MQRKSYKHLAQWTWTQTQMPPISTFTLIGTHIVLQLILFQYFLYIHNIIALKKQNCTLLQ